MRLWNALRPKPSAPPPNPTRARRRLRETESLVASVRAKLVELRARLNQEPGPNFLADAAFPPRPGAPRAHNPRAPHPKRKDGQR